MKKIRLIMVALFVFFAVLFVLAGCDSNKSSNTEEKGNTDADKADEMANNDSEDVDKGTGSDEKTVPDEDIVLVTNGCTNWQKQESPATDDIWVIWGSSAVDIYAAGNKGVILHSTGNGTWTQQTNPVAAEDTPLYAFWGSGAGDLYAAGDKGIILHSTGDGVWTQQNSGVDAAVSFRTIWGSGANDIYAVGNNGTILHSTGDGTWTAQTDNATSINSGVWGSSAGDVYIVGEDSETYVVFLKHSTGNGIWTTTQGDASFYISITGNSSGYPLYISSLSGVFYKASASANWVLQDTNVQYQKLWLSASGSLYGVGTAKEFGGGSKISYSDGDGHWVVVGKNDNYTALLGVWASDETNIYAVGQGGMIMHCKK